MKKIIFLFVLISTTFFTTTAQENSSDLNIEMFLLRKGVDVSIALFSNKSKIPNEIVIERKSTAPLSTFRKAILLSKEELATLDEKGKLLLKDLYPESRQLDSYYRIAYKTGDTTIAYTKTVFLTQTEGTEGVTFGDHKKDEAMFEPEPDNIDRSYEGNNIAFNIKRINSKVLITVGAKNSPLKGEWFIERKSSAPLATFRRVKTIYDEDLEAVLNGERVFLDTYPESRKLDSYYRLVVENKEDVRFEMPAIFLAGDASN